jgi:hypothetical protein
MVTANSIEKTPILAVGFGDMRDELYWQNGQLFVDCILDTLEFPNHKIATISAQHCLKVRTDMLNSNSNYGQDQRLAWDAMCKEIKRQLSSK